MSVSDWLIPVISGTGVAISGGFAFWGSSRGTKRARDLSFDERYWDARFDLYKRIVVVVTKLSEAGMKNNEEEYFGEADKLASFYGELQLLGSAAVVLRYNQIMLFLDGVKRVMFDSEIVLRADLQGAYEDFVSAHHGHETNLITAFRQEMRGNVQDDGPITYFDPVTGNWSKSE